MSENTPILYSVPQLAGILGVTERVADYAIRKASIRPFIWIANKRYFCPDSIGEVRAAIHATHNKSHPNPVQLVKLTNVHIGRIVNSHRKRTAFAQFARNIG